MLIAHIIRIDNGRHHQKSIRKEKRDNTMGLYLFQT